VGRIIALWGRIVKGDCPVGGVGTKSSEHTKHERKRFSQDSLAG
jgi:hypothetical protein